ncbi:helix-turn-helix transcriptional regulator [Caballeronia sp. LZ025]|uniref:AraC family transcriptional regulator n=1 Tax=Caballeronia TaxID=1827195 RepID=UPI001FD21352|nr:MULTISPECIES: helix-turn-helix transcriptional regulator [Caballeronia]MDR5734038.1 helix-turn-helix transcriptional regulator [Caballeronia sp. LZ025]
MIRSVHVDGTERRVDIPGAEGEQPPHRHRKGQLVFALRGSVMCKVADALHMVLPQSGVWIPSHVPHSNHASPNAQIIMLYVEPDALALPEHCCILSISAMVREMIFHLADNGDKFEDKARYARFGQVLLDQLTSTPVEHLSLPLFSHPTLRMVCDSLIANPGDRRSKADWASLVAMSERTFGRLVMRGTGQSRWRQHLQLIVALRDLPEGATVRQVAISLRYESATAFIIIFKKAFGMPPGQFTLDRRPLLSAFRPEHTPDPAVQA